MSMTENEVLKDLQNYQGILKAKVRINASVNPEIALDAITEAIEVIQQYRAIGTVEELKALKEKSVAKKPIRNDLCTCPSCGTHNEIIKKRRNTVAFDTVYCWHCGQAIEIKRD